MEDLKIRLEELIHHLKELADTYYKLSLLKVTQKATNITAGILAGITTLFLFVITLFFLGMGLAWWLGSLLNSMPAGFFIVAGLFIIIMVAIIMLRRKIVFPMLKKAILKKLYE